MANPLVRAAFAATAVATVAAFFLAQQLKSEFPLVLRFASRPAAVSPNHDGYQDSTRVGFDLTQRAKVRFSIVDSEGNEVRRLLDDRTLRGDRHYRFRWDARDSSGRIVPDGIYRMRVVRRDQGRVINSIKKIRVDTRPPSVRILSARPGVIAPAQPGRRPRVVIRYAGPRNFAPEFRVFRTDGGPPRVVLRFRGDSHRRAIWNGYVRGHPAADGDYGFTARVRDAAGNTTDAPARVPTGASAPPGTGVTVASLTLRGPLGVVAAGSRARLQVGPFARRVEFALSRLGARRALRRGRRRGGRLRVRIPSRARTGVYLVRVRAGGHRAVWPLAVSGRLNGRPSAPRRRPLVVLPTMTWQGLDRVDDDLDGFADTLDNASTVRLDRPFANGKLPPDLRSEAGPLLRFLDRRRLPYDLTTDVALARGRGTALRRAPGLVFAGSERWEPLVLEQRLRGYVRNGGRLASFGSDSFRRRVQLGADRLGHPTAAADRNAFGELTALQRARAAPLAAGEDRLGLFGGARLFGSFTVFELSAGLPPGVRPLSSASREPGKPALVAYRLGRGLVIRMGTPQWSRQLQPGFDPALVRVTERLWRLSRAG